VNANFSSKRRLVAGFFFSLMLCFSMSAPQAHGPDGDHGGKAAHAPGHASAARLEAKSDLFELVAELEADQLSILIDRYATNEPVLKAEVEVESGAIKAKAKFQPEAGAFAVNDPALLKLLGTPGAHPLVFTIVALDETDLLDGVLNTSVAGAAALSHDAEFGHGQSRFPTWARWLSGAFLLLVLVGWLRFRKAKNVRKFSGAQA